MGKTILSCLLIEPAGVEEEKIGEVTQDRLTGLILLILIENLANTDELKR